MSITHYAISVPKLILARNIFFYIIYVFLNVIGFQYLRRKL